MKDSQFNPWRGIKIMVKFEMIQPESELSVITVTAQTTINLSGRTINIGPHCITFSGVAVLAYPDELILGQLAKKNGDKMYTDFDCEIITGPSWQEINQCCFSIPPRLYENFNSDEDDAQYWRITKLSWDQVQQGTAKRIRLKFNISQIGEHTLFRGYRTRLLRPGFLARSHFHLHHHATNLEQLAMSVQAVI